MTIFAALSLSAALRKSRSATILSNASKRSPLRGAQPPSDRSFSSPPTCALAACSSLQIIEGLAASHLYRGARIRATRLWWRERMTRGSEGRLSGRPFFCTPCRLIRYSMGTICGRFLYYTILVFSLSESRTSFVFEPRRFGSAQLSGRPFLLLPSRHCTACSTNHLS